MKPTWMFHVPGEIQLYKGSHAQPFEIVHLRALSSSGAQGQSWNAVVLEQAVNIGRAGGT